MGNNPVAGVDPDGGCVGDDCDKGIVKRDANWDNELGAYILPELEKTDWRYFANKGSIFNRVTDIWRREGLNYSTYGSINMGWWTQKQISLPDYVGISISVTGSLASLGGTMGFSLMTAPSNEDGQKHVLYFDSGWAPSVDWSASIKVHWGYSSNKGFNINNLDGKANSYNLGAGPLNFGYDFGVDQYPNYFGYSTGFSLSPLWLRGSMGVTVTNSIPIVKF
jgi:hypothetical protein